MKRKTAGLVLAGAMCISMLSGCGDSSSSSNPAQEMMDRYSQYVTLGNYVGVEYTPQVTEVTDEEIQYYVEQFISNYTTTEEVTEGTVEMGDSVNIDYVGTIDGVEFEGGSTNGAGTTITLGEAGYIDDFEEQVAGHEVGDNFDIEVTFPDDYGNEELNGKDAVFNITINAIMVETVPEYNDEMVAEYTDYDTTEDYEAYLRGYLEDAYASNDQSANQSAVLTAVIDSSIISQYPEQEISELIDETIAEVQESAESNEIDLDMYLTYVYGFDNEEDFTAYVEETITSYMEEKMIISSIAKAENMEVTEEDVSAMQQEILDAYGYTDIADLEGYFSEEDYYYYAMAEKVMDFLMENAVAVDATPTDATPEDASDTDATLMDAE